MKKLLLFSVMKKIIPYIILALLQVLRITAQPHSNGLSELSTNAANLGAIGTEYYVAFLPNDAASPVRFVGLYITSQKSTSCTLDIPGQNSKTIRVEAGKVSVVALDLSVEQKSSETVLNGAIHITSQNPISVLAINSRNKSTASFAVLPVHYWGKDYLPVTLPNADNDRVCRFMVIANEDSTNVSITPSVNTTKYSANQKITVKLNKGQVYMVSARQGETGVRDLTASVIKANKPIGVISGHTRTPIIAEGGFKTGLFTAHQAFMMLPDSSWGKDFIALPSRTEGDRFRLVASQDSTIITVSHLRPFLPADKETIRLDRGEIKDIYKINFLPITNPTLWSSNKPLFLAQMRTSGGDFPVADNSPNMLPLVATSAFSNRTMFGLPNDINSDNFKEHKIILFAKGDNSKSINDPTNPLHSIKIDDKILVENSPNILSQQLDKTDWYWDTIKISSGSHIITSQEGYPICAELSGGNAIGDFYLCTAPTWIKPIEADTKPPTFVKILEEKEKGKIKVLLTDRTPTYFSGIASIALSNSTGWQIVHDGISNNPDEDAEPQFKAINDPSGELNITVTDNEGNSQTIKIHDNICFKTAYLRDSSVTITVEQGKVAFAIREVIANSCGDSANIMFMDFSSGDAIKFLTVEPTNGSLPTLLQPNGKMGLRITANPSLSVSPGLYNALMRVGLKDSTLLLKVNVIVNNIGSVQELKQSTATVMPNPVLGNLYIDINDKSVKGIEITNVLGKNIYSFSKQEIEVGKLVWQGRNMAQEQAPNGIYFVKIFTDKETFLKKIVYSR